MILTHWCPRQLSEKWRMLNMGNAFALLPLGVTSFWLPEEQEEVVARRH
jgi:hypothetical protein